MNRITIMAPDRLCVYDQNSIDETMSFIDQLNKQAVKNEKQVLVDLSNLKEATAAASVLLFASANTAQLWAGSPSHVQFRFPREKDNPEGYKWVVKTGLGRALHSGSIEKLEDLVKTDVYFQSSTDPAKHLIDTVNFLTKEVDFNSNQIALLTSGISEAMLNVSHHAYKDPTTNDQIHRSKQLLVDKIGERWWQCAWFDKKAESWVFIICDLGIGIPKSFKNQSYIDNISNIPEYLSEAFTEGASRFQGRGRGNGSEDMKRLVKSFGSSEESLLIYSGGARYYYSSKMTAPNTQMLSSYFNGTLVEWELSTKGEEEQ